MNLLLGVGDLLGVYKWLRTQTAMKLKASNKLVTLEDRQLIDLISEHQDRDALTEIYARYRNTVGSFIRRRVFEPKLVDEIYNDVMFAVWQKAETYRADAKVSSWIYGIAYRVCLTHVRKEQKHTKDSSSVDFDTLPEKVEQENSVHEDRLDLVKRTMVRLKDHHRNVIELAYFDGHSLEEISQILELPLNTVKTRLFHARQKLKTMVASHD